MDLLKKSWVHVLIAGALISGTWLLVFGPKLPSQDMQRVVITDDDVNYLVASWQKTWQRPPTKEELSTAVLNYVRDEILYREALNRNFDENNAMVRRSLVMQMNMIAEGQGRSSAIDDASIAAYYDLRKEKFMQPARVSFVQIYYNPEKYEGSLDAFLNDELKRLSTATDEAVQQFGDAIMLERRFENLTEYDVANRFGEAFARDIMTLPANEWLGPVGSAYGLHLVFITRQSPEAPAPLELVRDDIIREMEYEEKEAAKEQFYTELMRQYSIVYQGEVKELMDGE